MRHGEHHKAFTKAITDLAYRHQLWRVFSDFAEMSALSISNALPPFRSEEREARYLKIAANYEANELAGMSRLLAITTLGLEDLDCDFLGGVFMDLELGNHWKGQFFTPFEVSRLMSDMLTHDMASTLETKPFVTVSEPAAGAGGMVLALAASLKARGVDYQRRIHVTAVDVDSTAAAMCYVQLSLHHIPAYVIEGNTLSLEQRTVYTTPAHHLGFWNLKLSREDHDAAPAPVVAIPEAPQLALFVA